VIDSQATMSDVPYFAFMTSLSARDNDNTDNTENTIPLKQLPVIHGYLISAIGSLYHATVLSRPPCRFWDHRP